MGDRTGISWADATINFWWSCTEVSPGCDHCYARTLARRRGVGWGPKAARVPIRGAWDLTARLQRRALREGRRLRVFTNSMSDFFDARGPAAIRAAAWEHIRCATQLDWLILTKRPKSIPSMLPRDWGDGYPNVWLGVSVEDQQRADERIPALSTVPASLRFLSCEPLLGPIEFRPCHRCNHPGDVLEWPCSYCKHRRFEIADWVIVGGESGPGHRRMDVGWLESIVDQCRAAGLPVHVKQDSGPRPGQQGRIPDAYWIRELRRAVAVVAP